MVEVQSFTSSGKEKGRLALPVEIFDFKCKEHLVYETIKSYLADQRLGLASTKKRSEVRGGGRKPFRQKGTGRARQGTRRSPLMPGGGVTFGPKPRDHSIRLPRKVRREALLSILSDRVREGKVCVIEKPILSEVKTKEIAQLLKTLGLMGERCLMILEMPEKNLWRAARNIPFLRMEEAKSLTTYPVVWAEKVILCEGVAERLKEIFLQ